VNERDSRSADKNFLRGYQVTEADGSTRFTTIYPGWYPGRTVHIHFKVRANAKSGKGQELTSQLYFDDLLTDRVHAQSPYAGKGQRAIKNQQDGLFRNGGRQLTLSLVEKSQGYEAIFDIGLQIA
jgi:protocatechuate 3,4-dioxygenase beta subunit